MEDDPTGTGIEYACEHCGGASVTRDAWAEWDIERQDWVLCATFDFSFCHSCHRSARLVARAAQGARPSYPPSP